jgi:hypothetical protein
MRTAFVAATGALLLTSIPASASSQLGTNPVAADVTRIADSLLRAQDFRRAMQEFDRLASANPNTSRLWYQLGIAASSAGESRRALEAFGKAFALAQNPTAAYNIGAMHARIGQRDSALVWLDSAVKIGFVAVPQFHSDPDLASVRSDPRFARVVAAAERAFYPCRAHPEARRFDFWIGEWDVQNTAGQPVGKSSIQLISGDCGLLENWTDARGGTGKSINAYNPATRSWQQFWVGQFGGVTEYRESTWSGSTLVFTARGARPDGTPVLQRLSFTPISAGKVRQHGELSTDGGSTWTTGYDFTYVRQKP